MRAQPHWVQSHPRAVGRNIRRNCQEGTRGVLRLCVPGVRVRRQSRPCPFRPLGKDNNSGRVKDSASGRQRLGGTANDDQPPTGAGGGGRGRRANDRDGVDGPTASERVATDGRWTARVGREQRRWRGMDGNKQQPTIDGGALAGGKQHTHHTHDTRERTGGIFFF